MQSEQPFFIVGAQRSGTTMLRLMLNAHPRLVVPFESSFITLYDRRLHEYGELTVRANVKRLLADIGRDMHVSRGGLIVDRDAILAKDIRTYADLVRAIFEVYAQSRGKPRWGDKTPDYGSDMDVLWRLFPGCKIIHIVRDGRDVAVSNRGISWGVRSLPRVAQLWRWETMVTRKLGRMIGTHYMELRFEDLVTNPARELQRICAHLGEEFDEAMLRYHESAAKEMPAESMQWHRSSVSAPKIDKIGLWRRELSTADRIIFEDHAGDALDEFGYERERHPRTLGSRTKELLYALRGR